MKPKNVVIENAEVYTRLKVFCAKTGKQIKSVVEEALRDHLDKRAEQD